MYAIIHEVVYEAAPEILYRSLVKADDICQWWSEADLKDGPKEILTVYFGPDGSHAVDFEVLKKLPNERVVWRCLSGPWEKMGEFIFQISADDRGARLNFRHEGWNAQDGFYGHCNSKWGFFFTVSLKNYLEKGAGQPHPDEPSI